VLNRVLRWFEEIGWDYDYTNDIDGDDE